MAKSRMQTAKDWLTVLFLSAGLIFLVLRSADSLSKVLSRPIVPGHIAPSQTDLATIFFGASSVGLIIFSLLLAGAAIIEWQSLKGDVRKVTEAAETTLKSATKETQANEEKVKNLEKELRGRVDAVMGAMIGTLHSRPDKDAQDEEARDYIAEAILHIRTGYDRLKNLESKGKFMALNNLVYFSCLLGDKANKDEILKHSRELLEVGRQFQHLPYAAPYLMTYCRVVLVYSSDRDEIEQAIAIAKNLLETGLTKLQRKEATYLVASLASQLQRGGRAMT